MNPDTLGLLSNVLNVALALFALWIAGRIVLRNLSFIQSNISSSRAMQLLIWLALGEIFTFPFLDTLGIVQLTISLDTTGDVYTLWGSVPPLIYDLCMVLTTLFIYGFTLMISWRLLFKRVPPILESIQLSSFEKVFSLLAIASLINHIVRFVLISIIFYQSPMLGVGLGKGTAGFFAGWLVGLLIVGITIYVMFELIAKKEDEIIETEG